MKVCSLWWIGVKLAMEFQISIIGKAATLSLGASPCGTFSITPKRVGSNTQLPLFFYWRMREYWCYIFIGAAVQLHRKEDILWYIVSCNVPRQNTQRNHMTRQRYFPRDNGEAPHTFKHMKCSSPLQRTRCQNLGNVGVFYTSITMRYWRRGHIFPPRWYVSCSISWEPLQEITNPAEEPFRADK